MKNVTNMVAVLSLAMFTTMAVAGNDAPSAQRESSRTSLASALKTNILQSLPLAVYGSIGAFSGSNLNGKAYAIPYTNAVFHWVWTVGLFGLSTAGKLLEVEKERMTGIVGETAVNAGFTGIIFATSYFWGLPVGLGVTAAFLGSRVVTAGDNSPIEFLKPRAAS